MKKRTAFTLIELLVVIAIIAILAAILFPVFARARENARRASCQSNLKQLALGVHQYTQDYDDRLPLPAWATLNSDGTPTISDKPFGTVSSTDALTDFHWDYRQRVTWVDEIMPYVKSQQIFLCPSDSYSQKRPRTATMGTISYGYNALLNGYSYCNFCAPASIDLESDAAFTNNGAGNWALRGQALSGITSTSYKILIGDRNGALRTSGALMAPASTADSNYVAASAIPAVQVDSSTNYGAYVLSETLFAGGADSNGRHFGGANVAFVDGHVKFLKATEPGFAFRNTGTGGGYSSGQAIRYWSPHSDGGL